MTFAIPPTLEARLRQIAQQQGRDVQAVIAEALAQFAETERPSTKGPGKNGPATVPGDFPLRGTVLRYDDPTEPALRDDDWETGR
jgi:hypothetical protein